MALVVPARLTGLELKGQLALVTENLGATGARGTSTSSDNADLRAKNMTTFEGDMGSNDEVDFDVK